MDNRVDRERASSFDHELWRNRLLSMQRAIRERLRERMAEQELERNAAALRDDDGDTIFGIDVDAEAPLLEHCEQWAEESCFVLVAEGIEPATGKVFGSGDPTVTVISDPIDGTRGLMFDKRSAWSLAGVAPHRGGRTTLADIELAVMTELPTTRMGRVDRMWAHRGQGAQGVREDLATGAEQTLPIRPSQSTDIRHTFASVCNFFQGGKELTARIDEEFCTALLGGWNELKAEVYSDQYISTGGQLAELMLGRDRLVLDLRPIIHRSLGHPDTLCCRPYDLCTELIAREAGCVVASPLGAAIDAPLDTTTNLGWTAFANRALAERALPILRAVLEQHGLI